MTDPISTRILVVDDQAENLELLNQMLKRKGFQVLTAISGEDGLKILREQLVDLILLDVNMPDESGYDVCARIKQLETYRNVPVIFVSAIEDTTIKVRAFQAGGVDYITRPYQVRELLARIQTQLDLRQQQQEQTTRHETEIKQLHRVNQIKDDFLRMVSHDIQNPISIILSQTDLIMMRDKAYWQENKKSAENLEVIRNTALRMARFVQDLLDFARIEANEYITRHETVLHDLLQQCLDDAKMIAEQKQITITYEPPTEKIVLLLAPQLFAQVILNLLTNAIKYSNNNTQVRLYTASTADEVSISISDNGIGIPDKALPQLFERFYRVEDGEHRQRSGSGLGLAIVKMIVEQHDGHITVDSEVGRGSKFTVHIPRNILPRDL